MQRVLFFALFVGLSITLGCGDTSKSTAKKSPSKSGDVKAPVKEKDGDAAPSTDDTSIKSDVPVVTDKDATSPQPVTTNEKTGPALTPVATDADDEKVNGKAPNDANTGDAAKLDLSVTGKTTPADAQKVANAKNQPGDWNQWGGSSLRNNVVAAKAPTEWEVGEFDSDTGEWNKQSSKNILWAVPLGSQTYGNTSVANGKVYVGTNNGAAYLRRYPAEVDLGVLLCFDAKDGKFLWQDSSEKLHTGRVHDWPLMGICSSPLIEGDRVYYVTSRGEVKCLDAEGFHDGENDGSVKSEKEDGLKKTPNAEWDEKSEADVVWVLDMMEELGVSQHNMANCSIAAAGDYLFVLTSNGVDDAHERLPSPFAASFIAVDKRTGRVSWSDNSPGPNVLHGQWSSPAYAVIDEVPQVLFAGGDGWLYSFDARGENGKSKLLWKFDCNPKESKYTLGGRADRNHLIATPVIYNNLVYIGVGEDPEHGEGVGHLWCIDPTKRGDVSPELVFNTADPGKQVPHKREQAMVKQDGDFTRPNPNSAAVWHYAKNDKNGDGKFEFDETMHRTCGTVAIKDDLVFVADFSGLVHCVDAKTGKPYWTHDMLAAAWGSPLIAGDCLYIGDEDGEVTILRVAKEEEVVSKDANGDPAGISMGNAVYSTPILANNVLYITNKSYLFAISDKAPMSNDK
jgi:outer membrane protein assembly factor BamB